MPWSPAQQRLFLTACSAAALDDASRYLVMRHAGCPNMTGRDQPSIKCERNTHRQLELAMATVEGIAASLGTAHKVPPPGRSKGGQGKDWRAIADDSSHAARERIERMANECRLRVPEVFADGFLSGFIARQTRHDDLLHPGLGHQTTLDGCDAAQLYRIIEGLKAWAGRVFHARGLKPHSFDITDRVKREFNARPSGRRSVA